MLKVLSEKTIGKPKAVIFDTDNTLYPYDTAHVAAIKAVFEKAEKMRGIDKKEVEQADLTSREDIKLKLGATASSHSRLLYFQRTIESLGLKTRILLTLDLEQTYWSTFLAHAELFPHVKEFLMKLKSNAIATANITDLTAQIQFRKMVYFGLDEYFDYVVTSEEAGRDKPDPRPFQLALDKLKIEPDRIWMIGDSALADMAGAGSFGIIKVQKIHQNVVQGKDSSKPDIIFKEYRSLESYFSKSFTD